MYKQATFAALMALSSISVQAASLLEVTVVDVNDKVVTVKSTAFLPSWVQDGATVTAAGWPSVIQSLKGQTLELHFDSSQQEALKPNVPLTIRQEAVESDGMTCG
jgi:uncharacterized cupredoxin-like copper-binding protein